MQKFKFYKDFDHRWYVDLPDFPGTKAELEMVSGADTMLNYMSEGQDKVELYISEDYFKNSDILRFTELATDIGDGAYYILETYKGIQFDITMWLCPVMLYVFKEYPKQLYISKIEE